jgi:hypothetical protein
MTPKRFDEWSHVVPQEQAAPQIFVLLNTVTDPALLTTWIEKEWANQSIPLYAHTPMKTILPSSPWLLEVNIQHGADIAEWVDQHQHIPWGWAYTSIEPWWAQVTHWRSYLQVMMGERLRAIRFQDPRILGVWLTRNETALWHGLLSPVQSVRLPNGDSYVSPLMTEARNETFPWVLPASLIDAWHRSEFGLEMKASDFDLSAWETLPEQAEYYFQQGGELKAQFKSVLTTLAAQGKDLHVLTLPQLFELLNDRYQGAAVCPTEKHAQIAS